MALRPLRAHPVHPPSARLWACCALIAGAALSACGGRAADGLEAIDGEPSPSSPGSNPGTSNPGTSNPGDQVPFGPVRETCEDNPLLAGCPYARGGSDRPPPPDEPEPGPDVEEDSPDAETQFIASAENILLSNCGGCHGPTLTAAQASATINYINDWDRLIETGLIQRCSPARSRIVEVMRSGEMPPRMSGLSPVTEVDIASVEESIDLDCQLR